MVHACLIGNLSIVVCPLNCLLKFNYNGLWIPPPPQHPMLGHTKALFFKKAKKNLVAIRLSPPSFQRAHLLDNTERLERSSRRLEAGYQIAVETGKNSESEQIVLLMHSGLHNT